MLKHLEKSNKNIKIKEISETEHSYDNYDIYTGCDEDGNRITEWDGEEQ